MNKLSVRFIINFLLLWVFPDLAMKKTIIRPNITRYEMPHTIAIAPLPNNQIFAFHRTSYSFLKVEKEKIEIVSKKKLDTELYNTDIFVHPQGNTKGNIIGMFGKKGIHLFSDHDLLPNPFQNEYDSNFLFSTQEPIFFVAAHRFLVSCNYESPSPKFNVLVKDWGAADRPNYIFCCPTEKRPYFLYTDVARDRICKIIQKNSSWCAHRLLDIISFVESDKCAYSPLGYICAVTHQDKNLYVINTETLEQKRRFKDIRVKDLLFLSNSRILCLFSEKNTIHCIDSKRWKEVLCIDVSIFYLNKYNAKFFSFANSRKIIIFDNTVSYPDHKPNLFVIDLPFNISNIDEYEQYPTIRLIKQLPNLPQELKKMIAAYVLALSKSE